MKIAQSILLTILVARVAAISLGLTATHPRGLEAAFDCVPSDRVSGEFATTQA